MTLQTVAMVVPPRPGLFEIGVVQEVFGVDRTDDGVPPIEFLACSETPGEPTVLDNGMSMTFPHALEAADRADLVVAPAYNGSPGPVSEEVLDVFRRAHARGAWVLSVCSARSCSATPGCSTVAPARRTGGTPTASARCSRRPRSTPTCSSWRTTGS